MLQILGFPFFESQAKWIAQLLSGKRTLPSPDDMMKAIKDFYRTKEIKGIPKRKTHEIASFEVPFRIVQNFNKQNRNKLR